MNPRLGALSWYSSLNIVLSDEYQDKAGKLGFVPLKGEILEKSRAAVERIGKWYIVHNIKLWNAWGKG